MTHFPCSISEHSIYPSITQYFPPIMLVLFSNSKNGDSNSKTHGFLPSPRLPSFLRFAKPTVTCTPITMPSSCKYTRQGYSRESSYDSTMSSTSTSQTQGTIHHRRSILRTNTSSPPPSLEGFTELFHSRVSTPFVTPVPSDESDSSDAKRWARMLRMQREFHCYKSARLEAAVEALERGEDPPIRESLCPHRK